MVRTLVVAVVSSVFSCVLTLSAVSAGFVPVAQASAQVPQLIQARGFEVVDHLGNRVAYLGEAQVSPILVLQGEGSSAVLISTRSIREAVPFIELKTPDGASVWRAP